MKKSAFNELFLDIMMQVKQTRDAGQKEYAHTEENVFANFERVAENLDISKEQALMVYLMKHIDGINAWVKGHKSQREDVRGRIKDAIVYLCLLWGMIQGDYPNDDEINKFLADKGFQKSGTFNPDTGEVSFPDYQAVGDETV